jgi:hypothetical protein
MLSSVMLESSYAKTYSKAHGSCVWRDVRAGSASADERREEQVTYLADILEEAGPDIAQRCYWDFGRWSDLWRLWRPPGADRPHPRDSSITLQARAVP